MTWWKIFGEECQCKMVNEKCHINVYWPVMFNCGNGVLEFFFKFLVRNELRKDKLQKNKNK